jgi:hypothetical protein
MQAKEHVASYQLELGISDLGPTPRHPQELTAPLPAAFAVLKKAAGSRWIPTGASLEAVRNFENGLVR